MATSYYFDTDEPVGVAELFIRARSRKFNIDIRLNTHLRTDIQA